MSSKKIIVYVGGHFRASTAWNIEQNVRRAEELAYTLWGIGFVVICPHTNTRFMDKFLPDKEILEGYLAIIPRCDVMIVLPFWRGSPGTCKEVETARQLNMPVFENVHELVRWRNENS